MIEERPENWWEYLDWKQMGVVLTHYNLWTEDMKAYVRTSLECEDCYGWCPDVCGESCPYTHKDAKEWVDIQSSKESANK